MKTLFAKPTYGYKVVDLYKDLGVIGAIIAADYGWWQKIVAITYPSNMASKVRILKAIGDNFIKEGAFDFQYTNLDEAYKDSTIKRQAIESSKTTYQWFYMVNKSDIVFGITENSIHGKSLCSIGHMMVNIMTTADLVRMYNNNDNTKVPYGEKYGFYFEAQGIKDTFCSELREMLIGMEVSNVPEVGEIKLTDVVIA